MGSPIEIGCVVRAPAEAAQREDFSIETLKQVEAGLTLEKNEELVGNIVRVSSPIQEGRVRAKVLKFGCVTHR